MNENKSTTYQKVWDAEEINQQIYTLRNQKKKRKVNTKQKDGNNKDQNRDK